MASQHADQRSDREFGASPWVRWQGKSKFAPGQSPPRPPEAAIARPGKGIIEGREPTADDDDIEEGNEDGNEDDNEDDNEDMRGGMAGVMGAGDAGFAPGT